MRITAFTEMLEKKPFRPFFVVLDNGRRIYVRHPEDVVVRDGLIIVFRANARFSMFETSVISLIKPARRR